VTFDGDLEIGSKFIHVDHAVVGKVDNHTAMAVNDVFIPTLIADLMVEIGHRFDGVGITHEGNALSPLPHCHIPCATRELVHAAPQSRLAGAFAFAAKLGTRTRVLRRRNARGIVNPESSDRYCTP
jgi:hypothetical protein